MFVRPLVYAADGLPRPARPGDGVSNPQLTALTADSNQTVTLSAVMGGIYKRTITSARTDTFPTAAAILAACPSMDIGDSFLLLVNAIGNTLTLAGGVGFTDSGTLTVATTTSRWFLFTKTSATTMTLIGL